MLKQAAIIVIFLILSSCGTNQIERCPGPASELLVGSDDLPDVEGNTAADLTEQSIHDMKQYYDLKRKDDALIDHGIEICKW